MRCSGICNCQLARRQPVDSHRSNHRLSVVAAKLRWVGGQRVEVIITLTISGPVLSCLKIVADVVPLRTVAYSALEEKTPRSHHRLHRTPRESSYLKC